MKKAVAVNVGISLIHKEAHPGNECLQMSYADSKTIAHFAPVPSFRFQAPGFTITVYGLQFTVLLQGIFLTGVKGMQGMGTYWKPIPLVLAFPCLSGFYPLYPFYPL